MKIDRFNAGNFASYQGTAIIVCIKKTLVKHAMLQGTDIAQPGIPYIQKTR